MKKITEYNKLCAEFLGMEFEIHSNTWRYKDLITTELLFHSDWNFIMNVVEAIENIDRNDEHGLFRLIRYGSSCNWNNLPPSINAETPKEAVVKAIYEFLKFYNLNN
jgi:hypothetical protein